MKFLQIGLGSMGKRRIRCLHALGHRDIVAFDPREDRRLGVGIDCRGRAIGGEDVFPGRRHDLDRQGSEIGLRVRCGNARLPDATAGESEGGCRQECGGLLTVDP